MDKANNDGGQAFPGAVPLPNARGEFAADFAFFGGMTLRDYYAGRAMPNQVGMGSPETRAKACFAEADAMLAARGSGDTRFQAGVEAWMDECFLPSLYSNMTERGDRLLEEVLELLQAHGYDRGRVATLVDYVWGRPPGEPRQEVGGVMVTLAGYCWIAGINMHAEGARELARITRPEVMAKIRAKQEAKRALHFDTPLPGGAIDG